MAKKMMINRNISMRVFNTHIEKDEPFELGEQFDRDPTKIDYLRKYGCVDYTEPEPVVEETVTPAPEPEAAPEPDEFEGVDDDALREYARGLGARYTSNMKRETLIEKIKELE